MSLVTCAISFFLPSRIRVSRTIRINSNSEVVMKELSDPVQWKVWYPGADTAGYFYESGVIKGLMIKKDPMLSLVITEAKENEVQAIYTRGNGDQKILSTWRIFPEIALNHVTVQWYMDFHIKWYPWEKFASLVYDKFYGSMIDKGLESLKSKSESN